MGFVSFRLACRPLAFPQCPFPRTFRMLDRDRLCVLALFVCVPSPIKRGCSPYTVPVRAFPGNLEPDSHVSCVSLGSGLIDCFSPFSEKSFFFFHLRVRAVPLPVHLSYGSPMADVLGGVKFRAVSHLGSSFFFTVAWFCRPSPPFLPPSPCFYGDVALFRLAREWLNCRTRFGWCDQRPQNHWLTCFSGFLS